MGQKVNPNGLRLGIIYDWKSKWFATKEYGDLLEKDIKIREYIYRKLKRAGISKIEIERAGDTVKVDIYTARPGIVIGKRGAEVDLLRSDLEKSVGDKVQINIQEIKRSELDAKLVAQSVADQLVARVSFRRAMKRAVSATIKAGAQGIKVGCAGRLGGSEMARREWYREGRVPLHTLRAEIDYGFARADTMFGTIGVKVWIYKGDIIEKQKGLEEKPKEEERETKVKREEVKKEKLELKEEKIEIQVKAKTDKAEIEKTPEPKEENVVEGKTEKKIETKTKKETDKPERKKKKENEEGVAE
ncbi:MAG TPA: 30S ribosomal protein S3 [Actinobacteria bacterium]|nr:30S ribosomal protein S3 [Actinomycetota bacterium]